MSSDATDPTDAAKLGKSGAPNVAPANGSAAANSAATLASGANTGDLARTAPVIGDPSLAAAIEALQQDLARRSRPADFSDPSIATLLELQARYVEDVGIEAIRHARRNDADVVSAADVEHGDSVVRAGGRRRAYLEAFGGILAGAGSGTFLQLAVDQSPSPLGLSIAAVITAVGLVVTSAGLFGRRG
jgi:hypothetical protein